MSAKIFQSELNRYLTLGYTPLKVFSENDLKVLEAFTLEWVRDVIRKGLDTDESIDIDALDLAKYHEWYERAGVRHDGLFGAKNRYAEPPSEIRKILLNDRLLAFLTLLGIQKIQLWTDPGLDWLGFRLIRPGKGDGYPTSCKNWGAANGVISVWCPVLGLTKHETIAFVPKSHLKDHKKYLPTKSKFTQGEFRLAPDQEAGMVYERPDLAPGEVLLYHPGILHTEDVVHSEITRINLEYRFKPCEH